MVRASARALLAACLSFLLLPGVRGEPIPDTPALQRPVTLRGERRTLGETLAELSKLSGVPLSVDEHCESAALAAGAADCPLRDLMTALAAASRLEWRAEADGSYRLRGPAFLPPLMDTAALLRLLSDACPPWARPAPDSGPPPAVSRSALMEQVYALLRRSARDRVDEGGEVPFADFPLIARQALMEHWRGMIRSDAAESLAPRWCVPADRLALRFHDPAQGIVVWGVAVRQDPPAPPTGAAARPGSRAEPEWLGVGANIGYQPGAVRWKPPPEPERGVLLSEAALAFAERARIGVVIADGGGLPAGEPKGATVSEGLAALLPEGERSRYRWESDGRACWLTRREAPAAAIAAEVTQRRQALLAALPPEYGEFLALPPSLAWSALGAAWVTLWHSFSPAERRPGRVVTAAQLSPEQRRQLIAALQGAAVHAIWMLLERAL
ncbi:MAG: hypothetical protein HY321_16070, partial [Armatimonadetes bacterium]|nr:hypothetical protein [Armatimonadota bacterium]